jgi:hypothetical protein
LSLSLSTDSSYETSPYPPWGSTVSHTSNGNEVVDLTDFGVVSSSANFLPPASRPLESLVEEEEGDASLDTTYNNDSSFATSSSSTNAVAGEGGGGGEREFDGASFGDESDDNVALGFDLEQDEGAAGVDVDEVEAASRIPYMGEEDDEEENGATEWGYDDEEEEEEEEEEGSLSAFNPSQNRDEALQRRVEKLQR